MRKVLAGAVIALASVLIFRSCTDQKEERMVLEENTALIQEQLQNVSKLIVTEGHFAEVYTYADSRELFGALIRADKKALVVVNAEVQVVYDLSKMDVVPDPENKTLVIRNLPKPEIKIHPDFEYYDVNADFFNPFEAADYNVIKKRVNASLMRKVQASTLMANAENRLITELGQFLVLTRAMGWTLIYEKQLITTTDAWNQLIH